MGYGHRCRLPCGPCPFILPRTPPATTWSSGDGSGELPGGDGHAIDLSLEDLEREARHVIGEMAYAYFAGGADDERLLAGNVEAWARWQLHPRVLAGVSGVDLATTLLGTAVSSPVVIAPTAVQRLAHDEGEIATGARCGRRGRTDGAVLARQLLARRGGRGGARRPPVDAGVHPARPGPYGRSGPARRRARLRRARPHRRYGGVGTPPQGAARRGAPAAGSGPAQRGRRQRRSVPTTAG